METPGNMTYDEFFRACDKSLDERNKLVVAVRLLPPNVLGPLRERITSHFKAMNELMRAKANLMHVIVRWRSYSPSESSARFQGEFFRTHDGGLREAAEWAYEKGIAEINALAQEMKQSAGEFDVLYDKCMEEEQGISVEARQVGMTFEPCLKRFAAENKALSATARKRSG